MGSVKYIGPMDCGESGKVYLFNVLRTGSTIAVKQFSDIPQKLKEHDDAWSKHSNNKEVGTKKLNAIDINRTLITSMEEHEGLMAGGIMVGNKLKEEFHRGVLFGLGIAFNENRKTMPHDDSTKMPLRSL